MPPPPPNLSDDLLGEVFLRLPPDDHESLLGASLTCKRWRRVIADPAFRRRHWELHGTPSVVGFLRIAGDVAYISNPASSRPCAPSPPGLVRRRPSPVLRGLVLPGALGLVRLRGRELLDCRHGRVLSRAPSPLLGTHLNYDLIVWDPLTKEQRCLPRLSPPLTDECGDYFNAAVLCSAAGCNHSMCQGGPFRVAFIWSHEHAMYARVYSSKTDNWSDVISVQLHCPHGLKHLGMLPCRNTLVGDTLYFHESWEYAWEYQLGAQRLSMIKGPPQLVSQMSIKGPPRPVSQMSDFLVMPMRNGGLGCMNIEEDESSLRLQLWLREAASDSEEVAQWSRNRAIDLEQLLPNGALPSPHWGSAPHPRLTSVELLAFAEGTDAIFVGTVAHNHPRAVYMVQLNSGRAKKVSEFDRLTLVFPYSSVCIPVTDASSTNEGPGHDASGA